MTHTHHQPRSVAGEEPRANTTILVIGEDASMRCGPVQILREAGFQVLDGGTAAEAADLAHRHRPALVLLDVDLSGAKGADVARKLQNDPALAGTFVILVFGTPADLGERAQSATDLAGGYIKRPFSNIELLTQVEAFLRIRAGREALRDSEERFRRIFQHTAAGMVLVSPDFCFLEVNPAFCKMLGYGESELLGRSFQDVTHPADRLGGAELTGRVLSGETNSFYFEKRYLRKDGTTVWGLVSSTLIRDAQGMPLYFVTQIVDITERKRAETALRESGEQHRAILKTAMDGFIQLNPEGSLLEVNEAYCRITGYSAEELVGMRVSDLEVNETPSDTAARIQRMMAQGEDRFESRHRRKDGSIIDVEASVQYRPGDGGRFVVFLRDITERKQAEDALRTSERRLREAQEVGHTGYLDWDIRTNEIVWSDETCRILGFEPGTCRPTIAATVALVSPEDRAFVEQRLADALRGKSDYDLEQRIVRPDGQVIHVHARGKVTRDAGGEPLRMMGTIVDITERKRHEEERERLRSELAQAQKMESIGRLAGGVAHDFNNLLTVINGYAGFLSKELAVRDPLREYALEIGEAGARAASLTSQLLAFSRKQAITPKPTNLNAVIADAERMLQRLIGEDIQLVTRPAPRLGLIMADPDQIHQVIMNLAVNARDAMPKGGGTIEITTADVDLNETAAAGRPGAAAGRYVQLTVTDNGMGMPEEVRRNIFEPFFTTKGKAKGTGLGLATVYGIVRQNDGWIEVDSEVGRGSTFRVHLPRIDAPATADEVKPPGTKAARGVETVLVVEDQEAVRRLARRVLESHGYQVLEAGNGAEAHAVSGLYARDIDLLLTDVVMPGIDGHTLSEQLRESRPNLRVILMSGFAEDVIAQRDAVASGLAYIQKPFNPEELAATVRKILDSPR
jgi:two-component system cell cycle sensor histidine kinase/response regulator CckA